MPNNSFSHKARLIEAIGLVLAGYFAYSVADLCSKKLLDVYSLYQILGVCGIVGLIITGVWLLACHGSGAFVPHNLKLHLFRALLVLGSSNFMVKSLQTLPLADFYGITFIVPFFVMILAIVFLGIYVYKRSEEKRVTPVSSPRPVEKTTNITVTKSSQPKINS